MHLLQTSQYILCHAIATLASDSTIKVFSRFSVPILPHHNNFFLV
uniref:Uncharacterized protein n=1 Tax=Anguilla anguilla TaxID=7936 RepID=A0A0E9QY36_ANGAN